MIKAENISKTYQSGEVKTQALKDVSCEIKDGEFVAIMGPSGSGKSTLMHILGCLDVPTGGKVFLEGKDVSKLSEDQLAQVRLNKIGFVFQTFNLLPRATVLRNVTLPLVYSETPKHKRREMAAAALKDAGLGESVFKHRSNQLSGGQKQRVAAARALVNNPLLILADEPTGNLDTETGEIVLGTFQKLNREQNRTIILITHEKYVAEHASRIINILDGSIVRDGKNRRQRFINNKRGG